MHILNKKYILHYNNIIIIVHNHIWHIVTSYLVVSHHKETPKQSVWCKIKEISLKDYTAKCGKNK